MTKSDEYIFANRLRRVEDVALEISSRTDLDTPYVLRQIEGWQRLRHKVPRWAETPGILFPPRIALEQCSSASAAEYKADIVRRLLPPDERDSMIDLTGGMGVDFSHLAPLFAQAIYVERQAEIAATARHNLPLLGIRHADCQLGDGIALLQSHPEEAFSLVYLDPARRDAHGGKTVLIEECEPNIAAHLSLLLQRGHIVVAKLSPMLDITRAIALLNSQQRGCVREVHVYAVGGECKDLVLVLDGRQCSPEPRIFCAEGSRGFSFLPSEEAEVVSEMASTLGEYLYEPGPAVLKAGAFRSVGQRYGLQKLHPNSHLYTADAHVEAFPGRAFRIVEVYGFSKSELRRLSSALCAASAAAGRKAAHPAANLAVRNFPESVATLRARLKIREGGGHYLFATTRADGSKCLILCRAVD